MEPNQTLDSIDQGIHENLCSLRVELIEKCLPLLGDLVLWPNSTVRRISNHLEDSFQTSFATAGSFFAFKSGHANFSGSLQPPVFAEFFVQTNTVEQAQFWFFSHNMAGAGRGVQCMLPCRVWRLEPFTRTRKEALKHPRAIAAKQFWGNVKQEYERVVQEIMIPKVLSNPDFY